MRVAATGVDHVISATLDNVTEKLTAKQDDVQLQLPPSVYYGGMDVSANTFGELIAVWFSDQLTPSTPAVPNCCCSKGLVSYWSNPPF